MMAKDNKKLVEAITSMDVDFAQWYTDVVKKAELIDYSAVKGCMIIRPAGYAIWENIQKEPQIQRDRRGECIHAAFYSGEPARKREGSRGGICTGGCMGNLRRIEPVAGASLCQTYI